MNLGVETIWAAMKMAIWSMFQHSLMNLGVETQPGVLAGAYVRPVSAFSDESWGGDLIHAPFDGTVVFQFQHSLMNLGVETRFDCADGDIGSRFSIL